jgi:DNA-binding transcriptional ArsR family regulator
MLRPVKSRIELRLSDYQPHHLDSSHDSLKFSVDTSALGAILKRMLQYESQSLDRAFRALSDPGRRAMIERLSLGPASVSELAQPLPMTLSAVTQHLKVLEDAGLVKSGKVGRVRTCTLQIAAMAQAERWITERKCFWEQQYDQLEAYLAQAPSTGGIE